MLTEEGAGGEDGDYERLLVRGEVVTEGDVGVSGVVTEGAQPVVHLDDTRDGAGVVTEEDTTEGSEGSHGYTGEFVLASGGTDTSACSDWTTRHGERVECGGEKEVCGEWGEYRGGGESEAGVGTFYR